MRGLAILVFGYVAIPMLGIAACGGKVTEGAGSGVSGTGASSVGSVAGAGASSGSVPGASGDAATGAVSGYGSGASPSGGLMTGGTGSRSPGSGYAVGSGSGFGYQTGSTGSNGSGMSVGPSGSAGISPFSTCAPSYSPNVGSLPFIVDKYYVPSGWMGDAPAYPATPANPVNGLPAKPASTARMQLFPVGYSNTAQDACTLDGVGRSSPTAQSSCWKVVFTPYPKTIGYGWAGAFWQHPMNNWGTAGGFTVPPGATKVSFWVHGTSGGERIRFFTGEGMTFPCADYVSAAQVDSVLASPPTWEHFTIDISGLDYTHCAGYPNCFTFPGSYFGGVLGAFGFGVGDQTLPALNGGSAPPNGTVIAGGPQPLSGGPPFYFSTITFYIDDIEWQP